MSAAAGVVFAKELETSSGGVRSPTWLARGLAGLRQLAPYAAIELLLPGGSLIALVLWLYRRHKNAVQVSARSETGRAASVESGAGANHRRRQPEQQVDAHQ